jgi:H+/Cl- antiporter ClcA
MLRRLINSRVRRYGYHGYVWILGSLLVGLVAAGFAMASEYAFALNQKLIGISPFISLALMPAGFALCAWLCRRFFAGAQGSGIPQAIAALGVEDPVKKSHLLSLRIALGKIVLTLLGLVAGASIGREGPTVQIGASIMHSFYGRGIFRSVALRRKLILAGGAAGIAAAFNTPLAGIMFAIEELSKEHVFNANSSVLLTVILSGLISLALLGNYTYFGSTDALLDWSSGLPAILACGIVCGVAGGVFSRLMQSPAQMLPARAIDFAKRRPVAFAALCGLVVAVLGFCTSGIVYGTGYQATREALENDVTLPWYFGLAKMVATLLPSISGIPGGIFAPSLSVGAGFGENVAMFLPSTQHSAVILLAMAAYLAGVTRAPLTAFIIMMEMTNSHQMLLPLMMVSFIASGISRLISPVPLYAALAERFAGPPVKDTSKETSAPAP